MAGSGAVIVMDDRRSMVDLAMRTARFYAHESCGQCVPCREGTEWVYMILKRLNSGHGTKKDIDTIVEACSNMAGKTICVLSDACAMPVTSFVKKFRHEFEAIARSESEVAAALPKVSGQMGGLMEAILARQTQK
jgi:NADH-quinone oxidoreductase subunit F